MTPLHLRAYALTAAVLTGNYLVIPFLPAYFVANLGRPPGDVKVA
jgi:hypothetical protein